MISRSWLFVAGHDERRLRGAFDRGADEVIVDLEDAVPPDRLAEARQRTAAVLAGQRGWVRINAARTSAAAADLDAVAGVAHGIRIPKTESAEDVAWVTTRAPGLPIVCAIETPRGVLAATEIAAAPGVVRLALGGLDLIRSLGLGDDPIALLHVRSHLVVSSAAAGLAGPIDSVYPHLDDDDGLRAATYGARELGFAGKSAVHPRQIGVINDVFTPTSDAIARANEIVEAFAAAGGEAVRLPDGQFVDAPVVARARAVLSRP